MKLKYGKMNNVNINEMTASQSGLALIREVSLQCARHFYWHILISIGKTTEATGSCHLPVLEQKKDVHKVKDVKPVSSKEVLNPLWSILYKGMGKLPGWRIRMEK